jgi:hypothetical protein
MVDPPLAGVPSWHADPSGRHELRWWDGQELTNQVADRGIVSTDDGPVAPPTPPEVAPSSPSGRRAGVLAAVGLVVLVGAGAAVWYFLLRDAGSGTGTFEGRAAPDALGTHEVQVDAGTALAVRVEPGDDLDAVVAIVVSDEDAERLEDLYADLGLIVVQDLDDAFGAVEDEQLDAFGEGVQAVLRSDVGFAGEEEEVLLAVPFALDATVVVAPFADDDDDEYTITIESFALDTDENDDGEDVLEAVIDGEDVPGSVQSLAEEMLEVVE